MAKSANPATITVGDTFKWTVAIENIGGAGNRTVYPVTFTENFPAGMTLAAAPTPYAVATSGGQTNCALASWSTTGGAGGSATFTFQYDQATYKITNNGTCELGFWVTTTAAAAGTNILNDDAEMAYDVSSEPSQVTSMLHPNITATPGVMGPVTINTATVTATATPTRTATPTPTRTSTPCPTSAAGVGCNWDNMTLTNSDWQNDTITNSTFQNSTLNNVDFQDASAANTNFTGATISNTDFDDANFTSASFSSATFSNSSFDNTNLTSAIFQNSTHTNSDFQDATLTSANFQNSVHNGTDFQDATLTNANFQNAALTSTDFQDANLTGADFRGATFSSTTFSGATCTNVFVRSTASPSTVNNGTARYYKLTTSTTEDLTARWTQSGSKDFRLIIYSGTPTWATGGGTFPTGSTLTGTGTTVPSGTIAADSGQSSAASISTAYTSAPAGAYTILYWSPNTAGNNDVGTSSASVDYRRNTCPP
ncbi:MAG: pentapeptide repeat-containing protein [Chloroflexota bacterium]|nr:MAG: pentapeptide repeat-containing protein [Chloroflexota bacterium]